MGLLPGHISQAYGEQVPQNEISKKISMISQKVAPLKFHKLNAFNQEAVDKEKQTKLFPVPMTIFVDFPVNSTFVEKSQHSYIASKGDTSDEFTFRKTKMTGGLIYLPGCYLSADVKLKWGQGGISIGTIYNYTSYPLNTWAKQMQLTINGVNIGIAHSFNQEMAYLHKLLMTSEDTKKDLEGITLGYPDMPGHFDNLGDGAQNQNDTDDITNLGLKTKRLKFLGNSEVHIMDNIVFPLLSDGNQYVPSANEFKLSWTKASHSKIFMGTEYKCNATESSFHHTTAGTVPNLDHLKTHFKNFTWHLDYRTPNNQLKDALNLLLENKRAIVKSYVT